MKARIQVLIASLALLLTLALAAEPPEPDECCTIEAQVPASVMAWQRFQVSASGQNNCGPVDLYWCAVLPQPGQLTCWCGNSGTRKTSPFTTYLTKVGTHEWRLDYRNDVACTCVKTGTIEVLPSPCTIDCTIDIPESARLAVLVQAKVTSQFNSCFNTDKWFYMEWGDGNTKDLVGEGTFENNYQYEGAFDWRMTAYSGSRYGYEATCVKTGTIVIGCGLACSATVPATGGASAPVQFTSKVIQGTCPGTPSLSWVFGDGQTSSEANPSHTYQNPGNYNWSLTATLGGKSCTKNGTIAISPPECNVACTATVPESGTPGSPVPFASTATPSNCTGTARYDWAFGDGGTSTAQNPVHSYSEEKDYEWTLTVTVDDKTCTKRGTISISSCAVQCTATVPSTATVGTGVNFLSTGDAPGCTDEPEFEWVFGDGGTSAEQNPTHAYTRTGTFDWKLTVTADGLECVRSGSITVGCLQVGQISFCSDSVSNTGDTYTLAGNVRANGMLYFSGPVTYKGNPAGGSGTISTDGNILVKLQKGDQTLLSGPGLKFDVDGGASTLYPKLSNPNTTYVESLAGVPLVVNGLPIILDSGGVKTESTFYVGVLNIFTLVQAKAVQLYPPGGKRKLLSAQVVNGELVPSVKFLDMSLTYDPDLDKLEGKMSVGFPFIKDMWSIDLAVRVVQGCFNGMDLTLPLAEGVPIGTTGLELANLTVKMDNICVGQFTIFLGGDLGQAVPPIPAEFYQIKDIGIQYYYPLSFEVKGGTMTLLGYPMSETSGRINLNSLSATFRTSGNFLDILQGETRFNLIIPKAWFMGRYFGKLQIPDFQCAWTSIVCRAWRATLKASIGLPYLINEQSLEFNADYNQNGTSYGFFRGMINIPVVGSAAVLVETRPGEIHLLVGTNFENLFEVTESAPATPVGLEGSEKTVVLADAAEGAIFGVGADSTLPSIYLKTPAGATITPSNYSQFPGVTFISDNAEKVSIFRVQSASAGTWIVGADNLSPAQATFLALTAKPSPTLAFTSVNQAGDIVSMAASVTPASAGTKVSIFYSTLADGSAEGVIAEDLSAAGGSVTANWNTSGIPTGTYYITARADDGMNPPLTMMYGTPITVNHGEVQAPSGFSGTRTQTSATLSWTPSPSSSAVGHTIRYTDSPSVAGYPFSFPAARENGGAVEGLDPAKSYRFCAVAYDAQGTVSLESNAVTLTGGGKPGDCDGNGAVSIGEVQKAINMFLGLLAAGCGVDANGDGQVGIGDVQKVISAFLGVAPEIAVSISPTSATVQPGGTKQFSATVTGTSNTAVTWSVVGGAAGGSITQAGLYTAPQITGTYTIMAASKADPSKFAEAVVTVVGGACSLSCSASASPTSGTVPFAVNFTANSTTSNCSGSVTYSWNFGDGATSTAQNPAHTYTALGNYNWSVTASIGGATCTRGGTIAVAGGTCSIQCTASASPPSGQAPLTVQFGATAAPSNCQGQVAFSWSFGDGASSGQQNPGHTYSTAGTYNWSVTASIGGVTCTKNGSVTVTQGGGDTPLTLGVSRNDSITGSSRNSEWKFYYIDLQSPKIITVELTNLTGDVDLYTRFAEKPTLDLFDCRSYETGTPPESCETGGMDPGRYWIGVTNYDTGTISYAIKASEASGQCSIGCSATVMPIDSLRWQFGAQYQADGCSGQPFFLWHFGDGSTSTEQNPIHAYSSAGTYTWTLTVQVGGKECTSSGIVSAGRH